MLIPEANLHRINLTLGPELKNTQLKLPRQGELENLWVPPVESHLASKSQTMHLMPKTSAKILQIAIILPKLAVACAVADKALTILKAQICATKVEPIVCRTLKMCTAPLKEMVKSKLAKSLVRLLWTLVDMLRKIAV